MASLGEWVVDVIADFDPTKVVKGMKKTGKDGAKKFVEGFNKITGATLPTSISGAIAYGISKALTSTKEKLATLKKEADDILGRDQNNDQVARETGVSASILEALGRASEVSGGGGQGEINGLFKKINENIMTGQSKVGGNNTLDVFNNTLKILFDQKNDRSRAMMAKDLGAEELIPMVLGKNQKQFQAMLGGLGANSKGKVYNRDNAIARGRQNIENIRKKEQMIDIDKRDAVEKSASGKDTGATFEQMMVREQQLNTEKLINSINNLPDRMKVADAMDKTNEMMDTVGEKLASGMASLIETIKNIPFIGKYIRKVLDR